MTYFIFVCSFYCLVHYYGYLFFYLCMWVLSDTVYLYALIRTWAYLPVDLHTCLSPHFILLSLSVYINKWNTWLPSFYNRCWSTAWPRSFRVNDKLVLSCILPSLCSYFLVSFPSAIFLLRRRVPVLFKCVCTCEDIVVDKIWGINNRWNKTEDKTNNEKVRNRC